MYTIADNKGRTTSEPAPAFSTHHAERSGASAYSLRLWSQESYVNTPKKLRKTAKTSSFQNVKKWKILYNRFFFIPNTLMPPQSKIACRPLKTRNKAYFAQRQTSITHGLMFHVKHLFAQAKHRNFCQNPAQDIPRKPKSKQQENQAATSHSSM